MSCLFSTCSALFRATLRSHYAPLGAVNSNYAETSLHFAFPNWLRKLRIVAYVIHFLKLKDGTKNFVKNFSERAKIGGVQGEENFCPRAVSKIAKNFCVNQSASGFCSKKVLTSSNKHHLNEPHSQIKAIFRYFFGFCGAWTYVWRLL
jgi:hypothetical protein